MRIIGCIIEYFVHPKPKLDFLAHAALLRPGLLTTSGKKNSRPPRAISSSAACGPQVPADKVATSAVSGQYGAGKMGGKQVRAYRDEPGVAPDSNTETLAALELFVDNWRWHGVPFYLRTGKRLPVKASEIAIQFCRVPHRAFPPEAAPDFGPVRLIISIQPYEGIVMKIHAKQPGRDLRLRTDRVEHIDFFVADLVGTKGHRRFHRDEAEQLQQMILHHVAQRAGVVVVTAAMFDADLLGDRDRDVIDETLVPNRLEQRIREPKR
jgi:glucose-6-phosphate 1-dehydrogenase